MFTGSVQTNHQKSMLHAGDYEKLVHDNEYSLLRSLSVGVFQSSFNISIFLILIVNCNNVFIVLAFLELCRLLVGAISKFSVSFLLSSISLHLSSPTDSYSKKILRRRRNCLSESKESTPTFIFYEGGNCLFRATLEGQ